MSSAPVTESLATQKTNDITNIHNQQMSQLASLQQQLQNSGGQQNGILDMASVLSKIQSLEQEKRDMHAQLQQRDAKLEKLTESKR